MVALKLNHCRHDAFLGHNLGAVGQRSGVSESVQWTQCSRMFT